MPKTKSVLRSKTFWFFVSSLLASAVAVINRYLDTNTVDVELVITSIVSLVGIYLRTVTNEPVKIAR